jgi:hypothetical protein
MIDELRLSNGRSLITSKRCLHVCVLNRLIDKKTLLASIHSLV